MLANPSNMSYCKIVGNFKAFVADSQDIDDLPDFIPMQGTGQVWANIETTRNTLLGSKSTYFNSPISFTVDVNGDISLNDKKYVMVLADAPSLNPRGFNYSVLLNLYVPGEGRTRTYGPYAFEVVPDGQVDITDIMPVAVSAGVGIVQGPKGDIGPVGPMGPTGVIQFSGELDGGAPGTIFTNDQIFSGGTP